MKLGDIVVATGDFQLVCGSGVYSHAIVCQVEPLVLVSESGDMLWRHVSESNIRALCQAPSRVFIIAMMRFNEEIFSMKEPTNHALDNHKGLAEQAIAAKLWIDGTAPDDTYQGDAVNGPWVVFDIAAQKNIAGPFTYAQEARDALVTILNGTIEYEPR